MSQTKQNDFTMRIGDLVPENQELASVKPNDDLSQAMNVMTCNNYSQLPVRDEAGKLKGVISWRSIGEKGAELGSTRSMLVKDYMDTCVKAISLHTSLFDVIQEIEDRDYIVVADDNSEVKRIVTASDLANRFEKFSRAFAYIGGIDLQLRNLIEYKLNEAEAIRCALRGKYPECGGESEVDPGLIEKPDFGKYVRILNSRPDILNLSDKDENIVCQVDKVRLIRNKVMHFKNGKLEVATDSDIALLKSVLDKVKMLSRD